jgi:hypothetical protein
MRRSTERWPREVPVRARPSGGVAAAVGVTIAGKSVLSEPKFPELQIYGQEMLLLIGIVTLRAGHLEDYLVHFICAISGLSHFAARNLFFSTQNAKARLDMARALMASADLSEARREYADKLLDRAQSLADQRNNLIHAQYMISRTGGDPPPPPKRVRMQYKPLAKTPFKVEPVNIKEMERLAPGLCRFAAELLGFLCGRG